MGRIIQPKGKTGSLKWVQNIVNKDADVLDKAIKNSVGAGTRQNIEWLSPKADDDYAEYRDQAFLDLLNIKLSKTKLKDFWPARGPQWDALGRIGSGVKPCSLIKRYILNIISGKGWIDN